MYKCVIPNCVYNNLGRNRLTCPCKNELQESCTENWLYDSWVHEETLEYYYKRFKREWEEINHPGSVDKTLECAACGLQGEDMKFYNFKMYNVGDSIYSEDFKVCPRCGTVRFVCDDNRGYRAEAK